MSRDFVHVAKVTPDGATEPGTPSPAAGSADDASTATGRHRGRDRAIELRLPNGVCIDVGAGSSP